MFTCACLDSPSTRTPTDIDQLIRVTRHLAPFAHIHTHMSHLCRHITYTCYTHGDVLYHTDATSTRCHVVVAGAVRVMTHDMMHADATEREHERSERQRRKREAMHVQPIVRTQTVTHDAVDTPSHVTSARITRALHIHTAGTLFDETCLYLDPAPQHTHTALAYDAHAHAHDLLHTPILIAHIDRMHYISIMERWRTEHMSRMLEHASDMFRTWTQHHITSLLTYIQPRVWPQQHVVMQRGCENSFVYVIREGGCRAR